MYRFGSMLYFFKYAHREKVKDYYVVSTLHVFIVGMSLSRRCYTRGEEGMSCQSEMEVRRHMT